ncbi:hypothetical protein BDB01DRAFT_839259 [Pilobolus umbonatus]|nr:hypothetical protein BDB01DRAFT_839259 [Pilobolus umbonatus]
MAVGEDFALIGCYLILLVAHHGQFPKIRCLCPKLPSESDNQIITEYSHYLKWIQMLLFGVTRNVVKLVRKLGQLLGVVSRRTGPTLTTSVPRRGQTPKEHPEGNLSGVPVNLQ